MKTSVAAPPPPPAPTPVDPGQAALSYIQSISDPALQARLLAAEQQFRPQYAALNLADINAYLLGTGGQLGALELQDIAARRAAETEAGARGAAREADIADVERLGGRAAAAFREANPQLAAALARAEGLAAPTGGAFREFEQAALAQAGAPLMQVAAPEALGRGALGGGLYGEAVGAQGLGRVGSILGGRAAELAASRGQLTAEEIRASQQAIREAAAARGTEMGAGAITAEAVSRLAGERERMERDLALAASLNQATLAETAQNRAFRMGVQEADIARQAANRAAAMDVAGLNLQAGLTQQQQRLANLGLLGQARQGATAADRAYGLQLLGAQQGVASDPFQAILGRPSQAFAAGQAQPQFAAGLAQGMQGPQLFDPNAGINLALQNQANLANYQSAIYGSQAALAGAQSQARGAAIGAALGTMGTLGSAAIAKCWVAREVFGENNPKWKLFFRWKEEVGPAWFKRLYNRHGEAFAKFISNKPKLKALIRRWMESRIKNLS